MCFLLGLTGGCQAPAALLVLAALRVLFSIDVFRIWTVILGWAIVGIGAALSFIVL